MSGLTHIDAAGDARMVDVGDKDITAIGKDFAPAEVKATLGDYPVLARAAAAAIPGAKLVEFAALPTNR